MKKNYVINKWLHIKAFYSPVDYKFIPGIIASSNINIAFLNILGKNKLKNVTIYSACLTLSL